MPYRIVQSKQNARLKELRRALSGTGRRADGLAGIEGPNLLEEALRAGVRLDCVFVAEGEEGRLVGLGVGREIDVLVLPARLLNEALATETPQPVASLIEPREWGWADLLGGASGPAPLIVVLAGLQDPGNLGTILRSAEAFGASGVVSLPGTVSAWNPKAVRASTGSIFRVPMVAATASECFKHLREAGVRAFTASSHAVRPVGLSELARAAAIMIGNEGNGVPAEIAAMTDGEIAIPCPGPVESLNAAVAASVLLYEASRQRAGADRGRKP
jgi:TrmH family RNA methyltransferase